MSNHLRDLRLQEVAVAEFAPSPSKRTDLLQVAPIVSSLVRPLASRRKFIINSISSSNPKFRRIS